MAASAPITPALAQGRSRSNARSGAHGRPVEVMVKNTSILVWMLVAIAFFTALSLWDAERESRAALNDFASEQTSLAISLSTALGEKLATGTIGDPRQALTIARAIERPNALLALLATPDSGGLIASDGALLRSAALEDAVRTNQTSIRLTRPQAAAIGLPGRMAMAGLHAIDTAHGRWTVIVVATAQVERDRQARARWRLALGVIVTSGLVLAFGGLAMRKQRKELELSHALAITSLRTERDEKLVRADKLATMGALATGIAHEVSTPLGVILGRAEQLLPKQTDERGRRAVETIVAQTERIHVVIRGFLSLARGQQPALEHCEPYALSNAAVELVEHRFEKAKVELTFEASPDLPKVPCDPRLFEQVLVNLLLNACDACGSGGHVSLEVARAGERVTFAVTDDGVGISPHNAERVAEPFFTTKPEGKGSGLGLAIATEIVKHHRGTLTLSPGPSGRGTCALVELPAASTLLPSSDDQHA